MLIRTKRTENGLYVIVFTLPWFKKEYSPAHDKDVYKPYNKAWIFKGREKIGHYRGFSKNPFMGVTMFEGIGAEQLEKLAREQRLKDSGIKKRNE